MNNIYPTKVKIQGHLREIMVEDYEKCLNSVLVSKKYQVTANTVLKCCNSGSLKNGNSAPLIPARKYELRDLCLIYWLYEKENLKGDEILDHFEKYGFN